jgi:hypothetical protein
MQCPHCGKLQYGVCLDCDKHYFQVGVTIHNDSAVAALKERKVLTDKKNAEIKKLKKNVFRLRLIMTMAGSVFLLYLIVSNNRKSGPEPGPGPNAPVTISLPFDPEERIGPENHIVRDFYIESRQNVTIKIIAECLDCIDNYLRIFVLNEDNYRRFELGQLNYPIDVIVDTGSYIFSDYLDSGRYYAILRNISNIQAIAVKAEASVSYKRDDPSD